MNPLASLRAQMPVTGHWAYYDHAAVAPLPQPAAEAISSWAAAVAREGDVNWHIHNRAVAELRELSARLIGAETDEVAIVRNTTEGINFVAEGFPWKAGDNVVLPADEFPSNRFPWQHLTDKGVEARLVPPRDGQIQLEDLAEACDGHTRLVTCSWVGFASGQRIDVDALCEMAHRRGALVFLDAIQGLGICPLNVRQTPVDFLAADGHKWLLGPEGAGLFYLKREHLNLLRPIGIGWNSTTDRRDYIESELVLPDAAARYEGGTYAMPGIVGLAASFRLLSESGTAAIHAALQSFNCELARRLKELDAELPWWWADESPPDGAATPAQHARGGIVACRIPGIDPAHARRECLKHQVVLNARGGKIRLSPHAYMNDEDLERLIFAFRTIRG